MGICLVSGCSSAKPEPAAGAAATQPPEFNAGALPVSMKVSQRTTTAVPETKGSLLLTVGDVTRGQVEVSLALDGKPVLSPISLKETGTADFELKENRYRLTLGRLENHLIGDDFVTLELSEAGSRLTEPQKIESLIDAVANLQGAEFVRNGTAYSPKDAAEHLRSKLSQANGKKLSAQQFVEEIGSKSSLSGDDYLVRKTDGSEMPARDFLLKELRALDEPASTKAE
jgi:hypothetical protein